MKVINKDSRKLLINLFADKILSAFNNAKTHIQIVDCINFLIVNGFTEANDYINIFQLKDIFISENKDLFTQNEIDDFNIIDIIKYDTVPENKSELYFNFKFKDGKLFSSNDTDLTTPLFIISDFPYGSNVNKLEYLYSYYIVNHLHDLFGTSEITFKYSNLEIHDDYDIEIIGNFPVDNELVKSLILDIFDFNIDKFKDHTITDIQNNPDKFLDKRKDFIF